MKSRRQFLQKVTLSAAALPFLSSFAPHEQQRVAQDQPYDGPILKVALMGLGGYANIVAKAMQSSKKAKVVGLISGTPSKIKDWQERYNIPDKNCYNYDTYHQIKDNPDIDAVYVITPNSLHKEHSIGAANAGKHVICEKPLALNAKEGQEMIDACKANNVKLLVGYRMHFEPNTLEIIQKRDAGEFGKVLFFQGLSGFRIGDPNQWRLDKKLAGGGAMMDIGVYSINGARYMVGEEPIWVTAQETKTDPEKFKEGVDETITFQLGFPSGAIASCLSTYSMNHLDRFFLNGSNGFGELHPATGYGPIKGRTNKGELNHPHVPHQAVQMDEMAGIILEGKQNRVPVDGEEGLKDMKIIDAIYKAVKSGKQETLTL